ncbi:MAG: LysR family transcriptional regulator, partial [Comamonadaceae bacterium]
MTRRLPSLKQMEAFLAIEAARNLTEAANRLCVSQPALSRTLQLMEEALETRLFDRNARSVQLTDAGAMMLPIARRLMGEFREAFGIFDEYMEGHVGKVAVAGLSSVLAALVPGPARRFAVTAPGIRVELLGMLDQQVWEAVRAGSVDFGLATQPTSSTGLLFSP